MRIQRVLKVRPYVTIGVTALMIVALGTVTGRPIEISAAPVNPSNSSSDQQVRPCPDPARPIVVATPTIVPSATPTRANATPATPGPNISASSRLRNIQNLINPSGAVQATQTANPPGQPLPPPMPYDLIHTIVDYGPGINSGWVGYTGAANFIVIDGQIVLCMGNTQRMFGPGESASIPANRSFQLANTTGAIARISLVRLRPNPSPVPATDAPSYLGVRVVVQPNVGLRISEVLGGSPAAAAQLQVGDVITTIDGVAVNSLVSATLAQETDGYAIITAFFDVIERHRPGAVVNLSVLRNNQPVNVSVTLAALPTGLGNTGP